MSDPFEARLRATLRAWADEAPEPRTARTAALPPPRRGAPWFVAAAVLVVIALAAAVALADRREVVDVVDRPAGAVETDVGEAGGVRVLSVGDGALFVASENDRRVYRLDLDTRAVSDGPLLAVPDSVAVVDGVPYVVLEADGSDGRLARLDPETLATAASVGIEDGTPDALLAVGDQLWVVGPDPAGGRRLQVFDAATLEPVAVWPFFPGPGFQDVGPAGVWRSEPDAGTVVRLHPDTGGVLATVVVGGRPDAIVVGTDAVWVADVDGDRVLRIDPEREAVTATVPTGRYPHGLALDDEHLWVTNFHDGTLTEIDPLGAVARFTVPVGHRPGAVVLAAGSLWVGLNQERAVTRLDPSRLAERATTSIALVDRDVTLASGAHLSFRCMGRDRGGPTVLLEARPGAGSESWVLVQHAAQEDVRTCSYDRAGLVDPDAAPRTAEETATELAEGLDLAGIEGPFVVVGDLLGGVTAQAFATGHLDDVVGLVLVDTPTPGWIEEVAAVLDDGERADLLDALATDPELMGLTESFEQVGAGPGLGTLPLVVVSSDPALATAPAAEVLHRRVGELARSSTSGRLLVATGVGADPVLDAPEIVVGAILDVVALAD